MNKDFYFCKPVKNDTDPRKWHRKTTDKHDKNNNPLYQWCRQVYTNTCKNSPAQSTKYSQVKHGYGDDCVYSIKGCLTDNCEVKELK